MTDTGRVTEAVRRADTAPVAVESLPAPVLDAWGLSGCTVQREEGGLINRTFLVRARADGAVRAVVQRLHPVFAAEVNIDLQAVTDHLAAAGLATPRLLLTASGQRWFSHDGAVWRALTYIDGATFQAVPDLAHARAAGALVGRFHGALASLRHQFVFRRASVHDTAAHLARLDELVRGPRAADELAAPADLGRRILARAASLAPLGDLPRRPVHGDLKISNIMFTRGSAPPAGLCLIDLDTLGLQSIAYELGDAMRSWCNPIGEDSEATRFDADRFAAALAGYAETAGDLLVPREIDSIVPGLETVAVELAARFCVDAFEDRYFGWDPARFSSRRHHNLVRAGGQLALAEAVAADLPRTRDAVRAAFGA